MNLQEFQSQMDRMNEVYKGYYTPERMKVVWSIVRDVSQVFFEKRVGKILWADYPPKLDSFQRIRSDYESILEPAKSGAVADDPREISPDELEEMFIRAGLRKPRREEMT